MEYLGYINKAESLLTMTELVDSKSHISFLGEPRLEIEAWNRRKGVRSGRILSIKTIAGPLCLKVG